MERKIIGFHLDEKNAWVADLECGHTQHVRHHLPFEHRPWVVTETGRHGKLGEDLPCPGCDHLDFPDGFQAYKKTAIFDAHSIPAGLRRDHSTKAGIWAKIHILEGQLTYTVSPPVDAVFVLDPDHPGKIAPEVLHWVEPHGPVRFYVEFYKRAASANTPG